MNPSFDCDIVCIGKRLGQLCHRRRWLAWSGTAASRQFVVCLFGVKSTALDRSVKIDGANKSWRRRVPFFLFVFAFDLRFFPLTGSIVFQ